MSFPEKRSKNWYAIDLLVDQNGREAGEYGLMEAGALGTETRDAEDNTLLVIGYFDDLPNREFVRSTLADAIRLYDVPSASLRELDIREVPDEDWLAEWKKNWQPIETGKFIIAPPWNKPTGSAERIVITIEPGMAFGTGTHETTRLCLLAIEKHYDGGSFIDVGTGTGILAIAAAKMSSDGRIEAYDTDDAAVTIAKENARLNGVSDRITFSMGTIHETTASADLVCANLTADVIVALMPALIAVTCGRLVLSGILEPQVTAVLDRVRECGGPDPIEVTNAGEWNAIIL